MSRVRVGVVGCGTISSIYFTVGKTWDILEIAACADIAPERAQESAQKYGISRACSVDELINDPDIDIVLNLTIPKAHYEVAMRAVQAGKSVYNEKPITVDRREGQELLNLAESKGVLVGCAPDTFLGGGIQTCRKIIDDGIIGEPVAATAFMMGHGPEAWHPNPEFFYKYGGGPMFDMGPYYLTALVNLISPVRAVTGRARISFPERLITSEPYSGTKIQVEVPTHVVGVMDFENGAVGTIITSFDVWAAELPRIEIYGSKGTLSVPDPNTFGGPVRVRLAGESEWREMPLSHGYADNSRSIGLADMAYALKSGRPNRANGDLAYHVLDIMHAIHDSSREGRQIALRSTCQKPSALPVGLKPGTLDE